MNRRNFLKNLAAASAATASSSMCLNSPAFAAGSDRHYWVFVTANGGWDTTSMFDPKGHEVKSFKGSVNRYSQNDIRQAGNIRYAPVPDGINNQDYIKTFTEKYYRQLLVLNGVDMGTINHKTGIDIALSGSDSPAYPATAAMIATLNASYQPMPYINAGGSSKTAGLVAASALPREQVFSDLRNKDEWTAKNNRELLNQLKLDKLQRRASNSVTQRDAQTINQMLGARQSGSDVSDFIDRLPFSNNITRYQEYSEIIAAGFAEDISNSAQIQVGGFDTHSDSDKGQYGRIDELLSTVDHLWQELTRHNIAQYTTIVMASDMGRTPGYNKSQGKDHWPISSMLFMGKGITGNRVIGATNDELKAQKVNPASLELDGSGITLTPASIHQEIRKQNLLDRSLLDDKFPLGGAESLNLFT